jgi:hypothetical protein
MPFLQPLQTLVNVHEKKTFVRTSRGVFKNPVSTYGVLQVVMTDEYLVSVGSDGRVLLININQ